MKKIIALTHNGVGAVEELKECHQYMKDQLHPEYTDQLDNIRLHTEGALKRDLFILLERAMSDWMKYDKSHDASDRFNDSELLKTSGMSLDEFKEETGCSDDDINAMKNQFNLIQLVEANELYVFTSQGFNQLKEYFEAINALAEYTSIENPDTIEEAIYKNMGDYGKAVVRTREMFDAMGDGSRYEHGHALTEMDFNGAYDSDRTQGFYDRFTVARDEIDCDDDMLLRMIHKWNLIKTVDNNTTE